MIGSIPHLGTLVHRSSHLLSAHLVSPDDDCAGPLIAVLALNVVYLVWMKRGIRKARLVVDVTDFARTQCNLGGVLASMLSERPVIRPDLLIDHIFDCVVAL